MEKIEFGDMEAGAEPLLDEIDIDDMMRESLGLTMVRCEAYGDMFRPVYACYKHSRGEFKIEQAGAVMEQCVGCEKWMRAAGLSPHHAAGNAKGAAPERGRHRGRKHRATAREVVCDCGSRIWTNAPVTDCLKCGKIHVPED